MESAAVAGTPRVAEAAAGNWGAGAGGGGRRRAPPWGGPPPPADVIAAGAAVARIARVWAMPPTRPNHRAAVAGPVEPSLGLPADARAQVWAALARPTRPTVRCRCSGANGRLVLGPVPAVVPAPGFAAADTPRRAAAAGRTPADSSPPPAALAEEGSAAPPAPP